MKEKTDDVLGGEEMMGLLEELTELIEMSKTNAINFCRLGGMADLLKTICIFGIYCDICFLKYQIYKGLNDLVAIGLAFLYHYSFYQKWG